MTFQTPGLARLAAATCLMLATSAGGAAQAAQVVKGESGSINVDCDHWGSAEASVAMPAGGKYVSASAKWEHLSNIKESKVGQVQKKGGNYVATGKIRGVDANYVLGVRNCPGGGHGTLVISLTYK